MEVLFLPGNNPKNKEWARKLRDVLDGIFPISSVQDYGHWTTGRGEIDFERELKGVKKHIGDRAVIICAKSVGVLLSLRGISEGEFVPKSCIFIGTPLAWAEKRGLPVKEWLTSLKIRCLFIQNSNDPACSARDLKLLLEELKIKDSYLVEIVGDSHDYEDMAEIKKIIEGWVRNE